MTEFIESLKRLYLSGKLTVEKAEELFNKKKISKEEYMYIIS